MIFILLITEVLFARWKQMLVEKILMVDFPT